MLFRWLAGFDWGETALKNATQLQVLTIEGFCKKYLYHGTKTSLNHIRKLYCKHVLYKPGKVHCLTLECLKFQLSSSLPPQTKVEAFNSIFVMNFIHILMRKWWSIFSICWGFFYSYMKIKFYWVVLGLFQSIIGTFGLEGTRKSPHPIY